MDHKLRWFLQALKLLFGWVVILIFLYHLAYTNKIYPFVLLGPVDVSNLTLSRAEARLIQALPSAGEITLSFGGQSWPVNLTEIELVYDSTASASQAYLSGRSHSFFKDLILKWQRWRQPQQLALTFHYRTGQLDKIVADAELAINEDPINPGLLINREGQVELVIGKNGRVVDREKLIQVFIDRLGRADFSVIEVPTKLVTVDYTTEQLDAARVSAEILKGKKLILVDTDFSRSFAGQDLLDLLELDNHFSQTRVASLTAELAQAVDRPAQNAAFKFDGQKVVEFQAPLPGRILNQAVTGQLIINALNQLREDEAPEQTVDLIVDLTEPANSIADVNDLGIKELLGKGESYFRGSIAGRRHNIALASGRINGLLINPGETFSFNQAVGDISRETGYQSAYIIQNGRTVLGDGGGVCQVSTTLFRAVLNAGLEIIGRKAHAYRVGYYEQSSPAGLDATVFSPSVDFKFKNDTNNHILIQATVDANRSFLQFDLYGASDGRKATLSNFKLWDQSPPPPDLYVDDPSLPAGQIKQVDWKASGGKASFDWLVERNGELLFQKTFYSNYQPWQAVYLRGTGGV